ncbi:MULTISPECIES: hypothetical protein [unclassified Pseudomonas]|uniref:hypothetical protein n=1 Tax=unclassified Pseudomonas TaxID=196821 RepID=UPI0008E5830F|nr:MULTISPECIES: hypothetical protein [unclassified Pseudomonas]SFN34584.1 Uncharacterized membrane protein [Pseudomonas sp. ok602]
MLKDVPFSLAAALLMMAMTACTQSKPSGGAALALPSRTAAPSGEDARQFFARGNEPFWAIKTNGSTLIWLTPENPQGKPLRADQAVSADKVEYTGKDADKAFALLIVQAPCVDTMSGEAFNFTAVWTYAQQSHHGCAAGGE